MIRSARPLSPADAYAFGIGVFIAVLVYIPATLYFRRVLGLPVPPSAPPELRDDTRLTPVYWLPWLVSWFILLLPGIPFLVRGKFRLTGICYLLGAGLCGAVVGTFMIWFEYDGGLQMSS